MSEDSDTPEALGAIVETAFEIGGHSVLGPFAAALTGAIARHWRKRSMAAKDILMSELERQGATEADFSDAEEFAAGAIRYVHAVRDLAADQNLRILAQAMVGLARREKLWASDFLKYAEILAPLSRDELIFIGQLMNADAEFYATPQPDDSAPLLWLQVVESLAMVMGGEHAVYAVAARSQRSGLIVPLSTYGGTNYILSPIGRELREFVDIKSALGELDPR